MRYAARNAALSLALVALPGWASGQASVPVERTALQTIEVPPPGVTQELALRDGTRAIGRVESVADGHVVFRTTAGVMMEVSADQVLSVRLVRGTVVAGVFRPADPNPTRLFFGPTGRSTAAGSGYVGVYQIALPFVQVGVTDRFSVGAGTPLFFGGGSEHPFWVTPKLQVVSTPRAQAAVGVMHFLNVDEGNLGVAYGVATFGGADSALTAGAGYAYETSSGAIDGAAVGMIGYEHRISRRAKFVTENYVFSGGGFSMAGLRFLGERLSADLGLVVPIGSDTFFVFPMVNFVWQFGRQ